MKVLSARLAMKDGYAPEQFRHTIAEWLKAGPPSKEVGERYETEEISANPTTLKAGYCTLETFILTRPDAVYEACRLTHIYREQTWVTEVILKETEPDCKVYININCLGDTTGFNEIPTVRTEVIRAFVKEGLLKEDVLPISAEPVMLTGKEVDVVIDAINGSYRGSLPLVFVSKFFDSAGHEVDVQWLAKDLAGIGIVVAEEDDNYLEELKERTNRKNPFNGHKQVFGMFVGQEERVSIVIDNTFIDAVMDKFGEDVQLVDKGDGTALLNISVQISPAFLGWCCSFGDKLQVIYPQSVVAQVTDYVAQLAGKYVSHNGK